MIITSGSYLLYRSMVSATYCHAALLNKHASVT